eukprot:TRINITY_DN9909_c0_g1_i1.p1 TRINITY_DN9909_c0_g1~~TRINITY_DN9909_c0_g1_i1.p1  ORF type:complete len:232 (+),score=44.12 TRINITY_DN9909_c0_g1_i1:85-780(+)
MPILLAAACDPSVQDALLQHPEVQAAVKAAGESALADPEVQRKIVETAKTQFPEMAEQIGSQVAAWAEDPDVQAKAMNYAGTMARTAGKAAMEGSQRVLALIEQGPSGIRLLAFFGGILQSVLTIVGLLGHAVQMGYILHPIDFGLCFYQFLFGISVAIFEMPPWMVESFAWADGLQELLVENCSFMTHTRGRGLFYGFLSSLWLYSVEDVGARVVDARFLRWQVSTILSA